MQVQRLAYRGKKGDLSKEVNIKNKIKSKRKHNNLNEEMYLFYPREFGGYIFATMLLTLIFLPAGIMIIVLFIRERSNLYEPIIILSFLTLGIFLIIMSIYFIITVVELSRKCIYVEINKEYIRIKRFYGEKLINISDIKYVKRVSPYKNLFDYFTVKGETGKSSNSNKTIKFPTVWFSDNDVYRMVEYLKSNNPSLEISSFYTKIVRYNSKRKR